MQYRGPNNIAAIEAIEVSLGTVNTNLGTIDGKVSPPGNVGSGSRDVATAGTRLTLTAASTPARQVIITANPGNGGNIYVGGDTVSNAVYAKLLLPGEEFSIAIDDLQKLYLDADVNGDGVTFGYVW